MTVPVKAIDVMAAAIAAENNIVRWAEMDPEFDRGLAETIADALNAAGWQMVPPEGEDDRGQRRTH